MNKVFKFTARPNRFLKPVRSIFMLLLLLCCFQPAFATPTTPTSDFIDNGDGTVTHKLTGLVWMRCSMGQTWDKATASCTGTAATYTWDAAMALKSDFAGKSDWRLPNIAELQTIVERGNYSSTINTEVFSNTADSFLSSSIRTGTNTEAWLVNFYDGTVNFCQYCYLFGGEGDPFAEHFSIRLVRSSHSLAIDISTPDTDFANNGDGTVTHKRTGLMWQRCSVGQTWTGSTCSGTARSYTYDAAIALKNNFAGHSDWRVPNVYELASIVKYDAEPTINSTIFPNSPDSAFWSSLPFRSSGSGQAWLVDSFGRIEYYSTYYYPLLVRLVRGQWNNSFASDSSFKLRSTQDESKKFVFSKKVIEQTPSYVKANIRLLSARVAGT